MSLLARLADKTGLLGSFVAAAACASCFPAIASLGAAIGLGFLSPYEGLSVRVLLPAFAGVALLANALGWFSHRQWRRTALGLIGPLLVLAAVFVMRATGHRTDWLLYGGLALMIVLSSWDLLSPPRNAVCRAEGDPAGQD